jgi:ketosteroid isomerase-like protein
MNQPTTATLPENENENENENAVNAVERIFHAWDEALGAKDLDASMALYHPDATLESPLVRHLLGTAEGVVRGKDALRRFVEVVFANQPPERRRFRTTYLTDGAILTWEYPRATEDGDQMDIVEVMEIRDGLIAHHRVYWGWRSVSMLSDGSHPR